MYGLHDNRPRPIYHFSSMTPRHSHLKCTFLKISFVSRFPRDLETKKTPPDIEDCPEGLGAMLEY